MPRVLLIDHDHDQASVLQDALVRRDFAVTRVAEGADGLDEAKSLGPDCIVLAVELSNMSGYSVCNKLKRDRQLATIPLVLASAQATAETFAEHSRLRTHAEAYAHKPYDVDSLVATVASLVAPTTGDQGRSSGREVAVADRDATADGGLGRGLDPARYSTSEPQGSAPAEPAAQRRPARFGEEPSAYDTSRAPFFGDSTHSVTTPGQAAGQTQARAAGGLNGLRPSSPSSPSSSSSSSSPSSQVAPSRQDEVLPPPGKLGTDAELLLEKAIDPLHQTRIMENFVGEGAAGSSAADPQGLIAEALEALPPAAPATGDANSLDALQQRCDALQAAHDAAVARCAHAEAARDEALAQLELHSHRLQQIRSLLAD